MKEFFIRAMISNIHSKEPINSLKIIKLKSSTGLSDSLTLTLLNICEYMPNDS